MKKGRLTMMKWNGSEQKIRQRAMIAGCLIILWIAPVSAGTEPGLPLFTDTFDTPLTFAENWYFNQGTYSTNGACVTDSSVYMRRDLPADFHVSFDLTFEPGGKQKKLNSSQAGFVIKNGKGNESITASITSHGRVVRWRGREIPGFRMGSSVRMTLIRTCGVGSANYTFLVNGVEGWHETTLLPDALLKIPPPKEGASWDELLAKRGDTKAGRLEIYVYGAHKVRIDNFSLCAVKRSGRESPNMLVNSGFEYDTDGFPPYFGRQSGVDYSKHMESYEDFIATWSLDQEEKHSGRQSLKMVCGGLATSHWLGPCGAGMMKGFPIVFSAWLKSDREKLPVSINCGAGKKQVYVNKNWERYEVVCDKYDPGVRAVIQFRSPGTLWVDDLQAEIPRLIGKEAEIQFNAPDTLLEEDAKVDLTLLEGDPAADKTVSRATPYRPSERDHVRFVVRREKPPRERVVAAAKKKDTANEPPLAIMSRLNYYMNEPEAAFRIRTTVADAGRLKAVIGCAGKKAESPASAAFRMTLPLADIGEGTNAVTLKLLDADGAVVAAAETALVKRAYRKGATQINRFSRSLVHDGKPVVPFAPFAGDASFDLAFTPKIARWKLDLYEKYGFKFAHILVTSNCIGEHAGGCAFMEYAAKKGIGVILWTKYMEEFKNDDEGMKAMMRRLEYDNVLTQMVLDEPDVAIPSDVARDFMRKLRPFFPYHPVHSNNTFLMVPMRYANLETDILMIDDYLTNSMDVRTVESVVCNVDAMWEAGKPEGKPCFFFLVANNISHNHPREPTYNEQIAQTYGCIAAGCTGLSYFYGEPVTPGDWRALVQLNREVLSLTEPLCSDEECEEVTNDGDPRYLRHRTKRHDGSLYVVSCNIDEFDAGKVTFTLPAGTRYAERAEVLFEDRSVAVKNGVFADAYHGHARHVYKIGIKEKK